ncbi:hypothetical protein ASL11_07495 [Paenibacillus sp. Soil750]|nr:hypothetical protein ASL11_07495 [Paenibacillus sp. Soil750]
MVLSHIRYLEIAAETVKSDARLRGRITEHLAISEKKQGTRVHSVALFRCSQIASSTRLTA